MASRRFEGSTTSDSTNKGQKAERLDALLGMEWFPDYFAYAPGALALRECVRLAAMQGIELPEPILDVGCGDGIFARLCYPDRQVWGIDINPTEIRRAQSTAAYSTLICGNIVTCDLPKSYFRSAIANCSLEHVPDLHGALRTIHQALVQGAPFILIVPTPTWTQELVVPKILEELGLSTLARTYRDALDRVFFHVHLYDAPKWRSILEEAGFEVESVKGIVSKGVTAAFDLLLYPSAIGWLIKQLTGRWTLLPGLRRGLAPLFWALIHATVARFEESDPSRDHAGEFVICARKR
ncbi:MAG: class I SAM-dependent methyltransferase [Deltaproteobacteria bacterium]|nr:class I SAM-dependent methyltransferase [Deltaproteobacteria bacterium]